MPGSVGLTEDDDIKCGDYLALINKNMQNILAVMLMLTVLYLSVVQIQAMVTTKVSLLEQYCKIKE